MREVRSVEHLSGLYSVVVALALTVAVTTVIDIDGGSVRLDVVGVLGALTLLVTLIPFYHGGLRHLSDSYGTGRRVHKGLILWDFGLLFLEACVLLSAGAVIGSPEALAIALVTLWTLDILWIGGQLLFKGNPVATWARVNGGAISLTVIAWMLTDDPAESAKLAGVVFSIALLRSGLDYWTEREFYFPSIEITGSVNAK
jgi:hypothetical protein